MDWIRGQRLGRGSFATVSLALRQGCGDFLPPLMAVKSCGASSAPFLEKEKFILQELKDCPEIIRCFGDGFSYENGEELYNVFLEYAPGGSLAERVRITGERRLPEFEVRRYSRDLLRGLNYIHKFRYVHGDIKLQNILLDSSGGVKIADFGLARRARCKIAAGELRGTPLYMSPEMVAGGEHGAPADIWALGCAVSEMIAGSPAWRRSDDVAALLMRIGVGEESPEIPAALSEEGRDFLRKCFVKDPSERWTAEMLLRHPFVNGQDFDDATRARVEDLPSASPRCPFEFTDWTLPATCSIASLPSPLNCQESGLWRGSNLCNDRVPLVSSAERLRGLVSERDPDWGVADDWLAVR